MKLKFKDQDFQTAAVEAVAGLFAGQERSRATFSVMDEGQLPDQTSFGPAELGSLPLWGSPPALIPGCVRS